VDEQRRDNEGGDRESGQQDGLARPTRGQHNRRGRRAGGSPERAGRLVPPMQHPHGEEEKRHGSGEHERALEVSQRRVAHSVVGRDREPDTDRGSAAEHEVVAVTPHERLRLVARREGAAGADE
jgi:hypothetical protein